MECEVLDCGILDCAALDGEMLGAVFICEFMADDGLSDKVFTREALTMTVGLTLILGITLGMILGITWGMTLGITWGRLLTMTVGLMLCMRLGGVGACVPSLLLAIFWDLLDATLGGVVVATDSGCRGTSRTNNNRDCLMFNKISTMRMRCEKAGSITSGVTRFGRKYSTLLAMATPLRTVTIKPILVNFEKNLTYLSFDNLFNR